MSFDSKLQQSDAEGWWATLRRDGFNEDGEPVEGTLFAAARLFRVRVEDEDWFDELDAMSGDLAAVGEGPRDWSVLEDVDEESYFANSLLIVDFVSIVEAHRGSRLSHSFVRGVAHIFRHDAVALLPAIMSSDDSGELLVDERKREGLRRHWELAVSSRCPDPK